MPCYHPITAYRSRTGRNKDGKWPIVFNATEGYADKKLQLPCGKCIGCRLEKSRQWAMRCLDESKMHKNNCFITLTYNDDHLDSTGSLNKRDFVLFMKRLRKKYGSGIRFFHCGEYGEKGLRPHHHACIFGFDFSDKQLYAVRNNVPLYTSKGLMDLWTDSKGNSIGYSTIGEVTFESAAYVARYCTKKITGAKAEDHYKGRMPEYCTMSRMPGLGRMFYEKFKDDFYRNDINVIRGNVVCKPARYYDKLYDQTSGKLIPRLETLKKGDKIETNIKSFDLIKHRRMSASLKNPDNDPDRLDVKEFIKGEKFKLLRRSYEND